MGDLGGVGRLMIFVGLGLAAAGVVVLLLAQAGLPLGQLPLDFKFQASNLTCLVPLGTMVLLSLILTVIVNLVLRGMNK